MMIYSEYYYGSKKIDQFKSVRANTKPIDAERFDRLYTVVAQLIFRTEMVPVYASDYHTRLTAAPMWPSDFVAEQLGPGTTEDGRLLDVVVYSEKSMRQRVAGVVASVGIAPHSAAVIPNVFDLSTDGIHNWITDNESVRGISDIELERLTVDIQRA